MVAQIGVSENWTGDTQEVKLLESDNDQLEGGEEEVQGNAQDHGLTVCD